MFLFLNLAGVCCLSFLETRGVHSSPHLRIACWEVFGVADCYGCRETKEETKPQQKDSSLFLLFIIYYLLFVIYYIIYYLLFIIIYYILYIFYYLLFIIYYYLLLNLLFIIYYLLFIIIYYYLLFIIYYLLRDLSLLEVNQ